MKLLEAKLQKDCVTWLMLQHPHALFYHAPNEGKRSHAAWNMLKGMGTSGGFPDIIILEACGKYNGLAIELKSETGRVKHNQKNWLEALTMRGWKSVICRTLDEFMAAVNVYVKEGIKS